MKKFIAVTACAFAGVLSALPLSAKNLTALAQNYNIDYSSTGYNYVSLSGDQVLLGLGVTPYLYEDEYLKSGYPEAVKYSVPSGRYVDAVWDDTDVILSGREYAYTAVNGAQVVWQPVSVMSQPFTQSVTLSNFTQDYATVTYGATLSLPQGYVNEMLSAYPSLVQQNHDFLQQKNDQYDREYARYTEQLAQYEDYLAQKEKYDSDYALFQQYTREYRAWKAQKDAYDKYLEECAAYDAQWAEYQSYQDRLTQYAADEAAYRNYLSEYDEYKDKLKKYNDAINNPDYIKYLNHIAIIDYITTPIYLNGNPRTLYSAIMGDTVMTVLSRLGEINNNILSAAHIRKDAIDKAAKATYSLRAFLPDLINGKTDSDKYGNYINAYKSLRDNFVTLLQVLNYLYNKKMVNDEIVNRGKTEQFKILLAQLYYISNALYDGPIPSYYKKYVYWETTEKDQFYDFDASFKITDVFGQTSQTPKQIAGDATLDDLNSATPLQGNLASIPEMPTEPKPVPRPEYPQPVPRPVAPTPVDDPDKEPTAVSEPTEPTAVDSPVSPQKYVPTDGQSKLEEAYVQGNSLPPRTSYASPVGLDVTYDFKKYVQNFVETTVMFYGDSSSQEPNYEETVISGEHAEYQGPIPQKQKRGYTCEFFGWQDGEGNVVDLNDLPPRDYLKLYPYFKETPNLYPVTWVVEGAEYPAEAPYGSVPDYKQTFPEDPAKPNSADGRKYRFSGWEEELKPMSDEPTTYTAQFEASALITFIVEKDRYVLPFFNGETPELGFIPQKPDDSLRRYSFSNWDKTPSVVNGDASYLAVFSWEYLLPIGGTGAEITFSDGYCLADCSLFPVDKYEVSTVAEYAASHESGLKLRMSIGEVTFTEMDVLRLLDCGIRYFKLNSAQTDATSRGYASYEYSCTFEGDKPYTGLFTVRIAGNIDGPNSVMYSVDGDGNSREVRFTFADYYLQFSMDPSLKYIVYPVYSITVDPSSVVALSADLSIARNGQKITVTVGDPPEGMYIQKVYAKDALGNEILITNGYFIMPDSPVIVGVVCPYLEYTVTFVVDGNIISQKVYRYGEEVTPPSNPVKSPDGVYAYNFEGWDSPITPVYGDKTYTAVFTAAPIPIEEPAPMSKKTAFLLWVINNIIWIAVVTILVLIVGIVGLVLLIRRRSKPKTDNKKQN